MPAGNSEYVRRTPRRVSRREANQVHAQLVVDVQQGRTGPSRTLTTWFVGHDLRGVDLHGPNPLATLRVGELDRRSGRITDFIDLDTPDKVLPQAATTADALRLSMPTKLVKVTKP